MVSLIYRCSLGLVLGTLAVLGGCGSGVAVQGTGNLIANANAAQAAGTAGQAASGAQVALTPNMPASAGIADCLHCAP